MKAGRQDAVTEDHVRCQICGRWYEAITLAHLRKHGMSTAEYIEEFGRLSFFSLALRRRFSESARARRRVQRPMGTYVPRLLQDVLADLKRLARSGKTVEKRRMAELDGSLIVQADGAFGTWSKAMKMAGLPVPERREWREQNTKEAIRERVRRGQPLNSYAIQHDDPDVYQAAIRVFGSWQAGLASCGVDYDRVRKIRSWDRQSVGSALRLWAKKHGQLDHKKLCAGGSGLYQATIKSYGSLTRAGEELGLKVHMTMERWSKARVVEKIQELARRGEPLSASRVEEHHYPLYAAGMRRFRRWGKVLAAAGQDPAVWRCRREWTARSIGQALNKWVKTNGPLSVKALRRSDAGLVSIACGRYGSLERAARRFGLPFKAQRRRWSKRDVTEAMKVREERKEPLTAHRVITSHPSLYGAGLRLFGSWAAVLKAAKVRL